MSLSLILQRVLTAAGQSVDAHEHYMDELRKQWESESDDFEPKFLLILKATVTKCQVRWHPWLCKDACEQARA
jgi:hypothetical protein